jgi:hypothetical protein
MTMQGITLTAVANIKTAPSLKELDIKLGK